METDSATYRAPEPVLPVAAGPGATWHAPDAMPKGLSGLEHVSVRSNGRLTSISMDSVLYKVLEARVGGPDAARQWVQGIVNEINRLAALGLCTPPRDVNAGLSRLVQRQVFRMFTPM